MNTEWIKSKSQLLKKGCYVLLKNGEVLQTLGLEENYVNTPKGDVMKRDIDCVVEPKNQHP